MQFSRLKVVPPRDYATLDQEVNRVVAFKDAVRKLARAHRLEVEFDEGNIGRTLYVRFKDAAGKFGVFLSYLLVEQNPLDVPFGIIKRNITRKDRAQW